MKARLGSVWAMTLAFAALALAINWPHLTGGGRWSDDWGYTAGAAEHPGLQGCSPSVIDWTLRRPLAPAYLCLTHAALGSDARPHLALAIVWAVAATVALVLVLRQLGVSRLTAFLAGVLFLLSPVADASRLWPSAGHGGLAVALYGVGVLLALRAYSAATPRRSRALHVVSFACMTGSLLVYESAIFAVAGSFLIYRLAGFGRRRGRALAEIGLATTVIAIDGLAPTNYPTFDTPVELVRHALIVGRGALAVTSYSVLPVGDAYAYDAVRVLGGALAFGAAFFAIRVLRARSESGALRQHASLVIAGMGLTGAGFAMLLASPSYAPTAPGLGNRTNLLATAGIALFLAGAIRLILARSRIRHAAVFGSLLLLGTVSYGYLQTGRRDIDRLEAASVAQRQVLTALEPVAQHLARGTTLFVAGIGPSRAPGVPVFDASWDLDGAVRLRWPHRDLHARPVNGRAEVICERHGARIGGSIDVETKRVPYDRLRFVRLPAETAIAHDARSCRAITERLDPRRVTIG